MSNIISDAQEAFKEGLKVAADSTAFIGDIETGNMLIAITTGEALLSDVKSLINKSLKIFDDGQKIFEGPKAEVNSPEFKKFQTVQKDLEDVKKEVAKLFDDIKKGEYGEIPDDLAECVRMLKVAVSKASEVTSNVIKIFGSVVESVESSILVVENVFESVFESVEGFVESVEGFVEELVYAEDSTLNTI